MPFAGSSSTAGSGAPRSVSCFGENSMYDGENDGFT